MRTADRRQAGWQFGICAAGSEVVSTRVSPPLFAYWHAGPRITEELEPSPGPALPSARTAEVVTALGRQVADLLDPTVAARAPGDCSGWAAG